MRLLLLTLEVPFPPTNGHCLHLSTLIRTLARDGHEVTLISFADTDALEARDTDWRALCKDVEFIPWDGSTSESRHYLGRLLALASRWPYSARRFRSEEFAQCVRHHLAAEQFEAVICDEVFALANLAENLTVPVIVDTLAIAHLLLERYLPRLRNPLQRFYVQTESRKMRRWETDQLSRATVIAACSEVERAELQRLCPSVPVVLLPNVVDVDSYRAVEPPDDRTLLYTGGMDWYPNQDAVEFFARQVLPRIRERIPGVKFRVSGRRPPPSMLRRFARIDGVEFTGTVPEMREEINRAALCVVPLRIAIGTRIKILEAAALERAVVATRLGAEGLNFAEGEEIVLADEPAAFAEAVVELLIDKERRRKLGRAARRRVEESYSLTALRGALKTVLKTVTSGE